MHQQQHLAGEASSLPRTAWTQNRRKLSYFSRLGSDLVWRGKLAHIADLKCSSVSDGSVRKGSCNREFIQNKIPAPGPLPHSCLLPVPRQLQRGASLTLPPGEPSQGGQGCWDRPIARNCRMTGSNWLWKTLHLSHENLTCRLGQCDRPPGKWAGVRTQWDEQGSAPSPCVNKTLILNHRRWNSFQLGDAHSPCIANSTWWLAASLHSQACHIMFSSCLSSLLSASGLCSWTLDQAPETETEGEVVATPDS